MATIDVKWFRSDDEGAPSLTNGYGTLIAVLDAVLINGYNTKTVGSITRSGATATVDIPAGHLFRREDVVLIAGADQAEYNGEFRILSTGITSTAFQITVTGSPATPATGASITVKKAPLNSWQKVYSGTNKAVYRSTDPRSLGWYLRVDDSTSNFYSANLNGKIAQAWQYETMTDVDTGTNMCPTRAISGASSDNQYGVYLHKNQQTSVAGAWHVIGDWGIFYFLNPYYSAGNFYNMGWGFGDIIPVRAGDTSRSFLAGNRQVAANAASTGTAGDYYNSDYAAMFNNAGTASSAAAGYHCHLNRNNSLTTVCDPVWIGGNITECGGSGLGNGSLTFPNPADNGFYYHECRVYKTSTRRGKMPGLYIPAHSVPYSYNAYRDAARPQSTFMYGVMENGNSMLMIPIGIADAASAAAGSCCIDITGPWR